MSTSSELTDETDGPSAEQLEEYQLTKDQRVRLLQILRLLENAKDGREAIWFGPKDRQKVAELREIFEKP